MKRSDQTWALILLCGALWPTLPVEAAEPTGDDGLPASFTARLRFSVDREHGCSQSFENRAQSGTATLEVLPGGGATLTLEVREVTVFGPSLGSYKQGQRDFHQSSEKHRKVWRGKATTSADQLVIRLQSVSSVSVGLPQYGDAEFPPAVSHAADGSLTCTVGAVPAYPATPDPLVGAWDTEDQQTTPVPALRCGVGEFPDLLHDATQAEGGLPLGIAETLLLDGSNLFGDRRVVIRRVQPAGGTGSGGEPAGEEKPAGAGD